MEIPGFVDLQVNGYKNIEFSDSDLTEERFRYACKELLGHGVAAFLPTVICTTDEIYEQNLSIIAKVLSSGEFEGRLLGIHAEGPFISREPGAVGGHNVDCVRDCSIDLLDKLQDWADGHIKLITVAAELESAEVICKRAIEKGMVVSLGHHLAEPADLKRMAAAGATALTHLGNGMPNMSPRHDNPLWAGAAEEELVAMLITDGHHLPAPVIKTVIRAKGVEDIVVVSDQSALAGMPPGEYFLKTDRKVVLEKDGRLHNPDEGCLAGSSSTIFECMNYLASLRFLEIDELLEVGFYGPLRLIDVDPNLISANVSVKYDEDASVFELL